MTLKVLSVASEAAPLIKTGGLADVAGALPAALAEHGVAVSDITDTLNNQESAADQVSGQIDSIAHWSAGNARDAADSSDLASQTETSSRILAQAASAFRV